MTGLLVGCEMGFRVRDYLMCGGCGGNAMDCG